MQLRLRTGCQQVAIHHSDDEGRWQVTHGPKPQAVNRVAHGKQVTRMNDPIRIVPLHLPTDLYRPSPGIAAPPAAQLTVGCAQGLGALAYAVRLTMNTVLSSINAASPLARRWSSC